MKISLPDQEMKEAVNELNQAQTIRVTNTFNALSLCWK